MKVGLSDPNRIVDAIRCETCGTIMRSEGTVLICDSCKRPQFPNLPKSSGQPYWRRLAPEDIAAAWQVVEKSEGWADVERLWFGGRLHWDVALKFGSKEGNAVTDTVPLAICRAALKAVSSE